MPRPATRCGLAALVLLGAFWVTYVPDAGHGFLKDDFAWVARSRVAAPGDLVRPFLHTRDFYRPLVHVTFAADYAVWGDAPRGFGLTNVVLATLVAAAVTVLARRLGLSAAASLLAGSLWAFNFHGVNMAVLWLSGRTSLLSTLLAVASAALFLSRRLAASSIAFFGALLAKEEPVALPAVFVATQALFRDRLPYTRVQVALASAAPLAVHAWLRWRAGAFGPFTAPEFYRVTLDAGRLARNAWEYTDRAATTAVLVILLAMLAVRRRPRLDPLTVRVYAFGALWAVAGYGATLWLPSRSSLYAILPSVGTSIIAAAAISTIMRQAEPRTRVRVAAAALCLPLVLQPLYHRRNRQWVRLADLSARVVAAVRAVDSEVPPGATIVLVDDRSRSVNLAAVLGTLGDDMASLTLGREVHVWIEPPVAASHPARRPRPEKTALVLRLADGAIRRVP